MVPISKLYHSVIDTTLVCPDLYTLDQAADSSAACDLCNVGHASPKKDGSVVWDSDSAQGSQQLSPQLSPQNHKPQ